MSEIEKSVAWWNGLSGEQRYEFVAEIWRNEGKPEPKEKKKREKQKPKLDLQEVENLCYRSKRGTQTEREAVKFMDLFSEFSKLPEFKDAMLRGQARAISELPLQGTFDEVYSRLKKHA